MYDTILVPTDGSEVAELAVDHALEAWAHATDRRLSLREGTGAAGGPE